MTRAIPLIRAANVLPLVRFIETNGCDSAPYLDAVDLGYWFALSPMDAIPLRNGTELLEKIALKHGPDVGARIVSQASIGELAFIGRVVLGSRSPAEALERVSLAMPLHSTHELLWLEPSEAGITLVHRLDVSITPAVLHTVHVLLCAMVQQLCRYTALMPPLMSHISAAPHPRLGVDDLRAQFGSRVEPSRDGSLRITIASGVAHSPFRIVARNRLDGAGAASVLPLAEDMTLAGSVRPVIAAMLNTGEPSIQRLARAGGVSVRTLQRRLSQDGTSFSQELEQVRHRLALRLLQSRDIPLADLGERLGYSSPQALSRAVRRMVGASPGRIRSLVED